MTRPGSLAWFAAHEMRLVWRDFVAMLTAGRPARARMIVAAVAAFAMLLHWIAFVMLRSAGPIDAADPKVLVLITAAGLLVFALMLSQALESVTRAFYARHDLDLILASPAPSGTIFAVRIGAVALATGAMSALMAGPFVNVLAALAGWGWLAAYPVIFAAGAAAAGFAVAIGSSLFGLIGPRRTRLVAQVVAAVVGAAFVIGIQIGSILQTGQLSRIALLHSPDVLAALPEAQSFVWWPARAAAGDLLPLLGILAVAAALLLAAIRFHAERFADHAGAAAGVGEPAARSRRAGDLAVPANARSALRRKELVLIRRDPWLLSQSLMQLLYLVPPALLLWRDWGSGGAMVVLVPVLVMAAGQLGGGLAWLALSGEDAPDLVATAPIPPGAVVRAKIEAVAIGVAAAVGPFALALAWSSPSAAAITVAGAAVAVTAAASIQLTFRTQARRSQFRRRQTASRIATFAEAFSSISWAAAASLAALGSWFALAPAVFALAVLGTVQLMRPSR